jgi:hypothetical protein
MTTATIQTWQGSSGRVFLANSISGPLVASALVSFPIAAFTTIVASMDHRLPWSDVFLVAGTWPMVTVLFFLSSLIAGLGAALYAMIEVRRRGAYSVPIAIAIAMAVVVVSKVGILSTISGIDLSAISRIGPLLTAMVFAALGVAAAGWLARRSGATWRLS